MKEKTSRGLRKHFCKSRANTGRRMRECEHPDPVLNSYPLLDHPSAKHRQVVKKMAVAFKNSPKLAWHSKNNARIRNVRKRRLLFVQPQECGAIPTTRTESRFTSVVTTLFFRVGGIYFPAQSRRAAIEDCGEVFADCRASLGPIPNVPRCFQDVL